VLHIGLARDLAGAREIALALVVAVLGFWFNLAIGLAVGLALWWASRIGVRLAPART